MRGTESWPPGPPWLRACFEYKKILSSLKERHKISSSLSRLKRRLKILGLKRRNSRRVLHCCIPVASISRKIFSTARLAFSDDAKRNDIQLMSLGDPKSMLFVP